MKVSVLIYGLNSFSYIETCIRSVMNQTLQEIEILIIDGGSTDGTLDLVKKLAQTDKRIRLINSLPGVGLQFNTGLKEAKGEYIGICESDDYLLPDMYEKQYEIAKKYQLDILRADANHFIENEQGEAFMFPVKLAKQDTLYDNVLDLTKDDRILRLGINGFWSGLYRREFLLEHKIFMNETKGAAYQDTSFLFLASIKAKRVMLSREAFYCYRLDNPNSSVNYPRKITMLVEEYGLLKKRLIEENQFAQYKEIYLSWKINGYLGFYDSLSDELREQFIQIMYEDIRIELNSGLYEETALSEKGKMAADGVRQSLSVLRHDLHQMYKGFRDTKRALEQIAPQTEVVIFGTGEMGNMVYRYLLHNGKRIAAYVDNNRERWGKAVNGILVIAPEQAIRRYPDGVYIVANVAHFHEIEEQLLALFVKEDHIILCHNYDFFFKHILLRSLKEKSSAAQDREKAFMLEIKKKHSVLIYGAGMVGKLVYTRLLSNQLEDQVAGFMVSHKTQQEYLGLPVYEAGEPVPDFDRVCVIVATLPIWHEDILKNLSVCGFTDIQVVTEEQYQDLAASYMQEFRMKHTFQNKTIDVLFMASDNNFSSGAFLCMVDLNVELKKMGISSAVILPEHGNGEEVLIQNGIDYTYIPSRHWLRKQEEQVSYEQVEQENRSAVKEIEDLMEQYQVKLVHNNTIYTYVGAVAAHNKKIPYVWHIRENVEDQGFTFCDRQQAVRWMNQSERILAVSKFMASCYQGLDRNKIRVCYDGVDVERYYARPRNRFERKEVVIIQVGAIAPVKNQEELIRAAGRLKDKRIDFRIELIGSGQKQYIEKLRQLVKQYQLENNITFCGSQDPISLFYQKADIVVVCSKTESFGRVTAEAQLSGCLVIGSKTGATPELVQDEETGFLYQLGSPDDLAAKLIQAVSNPDRANRIARRGQEQAYARYSRKCCAERIKNQYEEVLAGQAGWP